MSNLWQKGTPVDVVDMMLAREQRVQLQKELLQQAETASLLSATMNIPGPIKNSPSLEKLFLAFIQQMQSLIEVHQIKLPVYRNLKTGPEYLCLLGCSPIVLKKQLVAFEETQKAGRLFDLDVLYLEAGAMQTLSRTALKLPPRKCFVCQTDAKVCGRERRHTIEEMQHEIEQLLEKG
jgi:holo-ACP synthase